MINNINQANSNISFTAFKVRASSQSFNQKVDDVQTLLYQIKKEQKAGHGSELWYGLIKRTGRGVPEASFKVSINLKSVRKLPEAKRVAANLAAEAELADYIKANYEGIEILPDINKDLKKVEIKNEWKRIKKIIKRVSEEIKGK